MTAVGRRPTLDELILALDAIKRVEADADALDPQKETFRVVLTFARSACPEDWRDGQPKPTWLFEQLFVELLAWRSARIHEEQWISKEEQYGASIDTLMAHWTEELKKNAALPQNMLTRAMQQIFSNTIMRLQELKERREAGGVTSHTENRREKARKAWMEDEYEAPRREEEQRRQRESREGPDDIWGEDIRRQADDLFRNRRDRTWEEIFGAFHGTHRGSTPPPRPTPNNKRSWYTILGVSAHASKKEITKAYRKLAIRYHPDRYKESDAHERMTEINTARDEGLRGL